MGANDAQKNNDPHEYQEDRNDHDDDDKDDDEGNDDDNVNSNGNGNVSHNSDASDEPVLKKARLQEPSTASTTQQDSDRPSDPVQPIFGSAASSAFAAFGMKKKHQEANEEKDPQQIQPQQGFFGFSNATGTGTGTGTAATPSVFGKGSSCATLGFGLTGNSTTTTSGFHSTFTSTSLSSSVFGGGATSSAFGTALPSSSSCDAVPNHESSSPDAGVSPPPPPIASVSHPIVALPVLIEPVRNGEENENAILMLRAKLFKLAKVKQEAQVVAQVNTADGEHGTKKSSVGIEMATKVGQLQDTTQSATAITTNDMDGSGTGAVKMDWKEVGIGPLRVLTCSSDKKDAARIVQRRENTPGGQGTKLILNVALRKECKVERKGDKFVRFAAFEVVEKGNMKDEDDEEKKIETPPQDYDSKHGTENNNAEGNTTTSAGKTDKDSVQFELVQYLFKVKTISEADMLLETLSKYCSTMKTTS